MAREEAEEEAELVRLSEGWSRARAVQLERLLATGDGEALQYFFGCIRC